MWVIFFMELQTSQIKYLVTSLSSAFLFIRSKRNQEVIVQRKRETSEPSRSGFKLAIPLSSRGIYFYFLSPCFLNCTMRTVISTSKSCWVNVYFRFQCTLAPSLALPFLFSRQVEWIKDFCGYTFLNVLYLVIKTNLQLISLNTSNLFWIYMISIG